MPDTIENIRPMPVRIYAENMAGQPDLYRITESRIRAVLPDGCDDVQIGVFDSARPDRGQLAVATHFVGFAFDPRIIRDHAEHLRVVHCTSAGVERYMPLDWLPSQAVLTNSRGVHAEKGGAFGAMSILMLNDHLPRLAASQRAHRWDRAVSTSIVGKHAVIYGFGSVGAAIARNIRRFGVSVTGVRRSGEPHPEADQMLAAKDFLCVLPNADFLVLTCPLTRETRGLVGEREIAQLPRGAGLVNIARGPVVDTNALTAALRSGHLSGAIVDVFEPEPIEAQSGLWDVPNLLITPHLSCDDSRGSLDQCLEIFGENIWRERKGQALMNVVDAQREY